MKNQTTSAGKYLRLLPDLAVFIGGERGGVLEYVQRKKKTIEVGVNLYPATRVTFSYKFRSEDTAESWMRENFLGESPGPGHPVDECADCGSVLHLYCAECDGEPTVHPHR